MIRPLTTEERELWEKLRSSVRPLRPDVPQSAAEPPEEEREGAARGGPGSPPKTPAAVRPAPAERPERRLEPLEERMRRRLSRGLLDVDARIDLHGMRQERAFTSLLAFLRRSQSRHHRLVLVITGKGRAGEDERGVLRYAVPLWLARPELRDLIVGFEEASRRHGGAGALYVRLRRRGETGRVG